ncbi:MAG: polysaccharide deacetylase family protein [Proteocatella sp.]
MKYVSITFDDGRKDNYDIAYPIMKKHGLMGTIYCTTGYIDGTWQKKKDWYSASSPLSKSELRDLYQNGWEIAIHGDKHITNFADWETAKNKIKSWGIDITYIGASLPDSKVNESIIKEIRCAKQVKYIRRGRHCDTHTLPVKILFALYTYGKNKFAYNEFNKDNVISVSNIDYFDLPSVVVRLEDDPKMICDFINHCEDNQWVILMLHSILPITDPLYATDPWNWSDEKFDSLCHQLSCAQSREKIVVAPVNKIINSLDLKCK